MSAVAPLTAQPLGDRKPEVTCAKCHLRESCLSGGVPAEEVERVERIVYARRRIKRGERLFDAGDPFTSVYAIRSGFFKTSLVDDEGREQVTGFFMAGELLGLDGLASGRYQDGAIALEDSEACVSAEERLATFLRNLSGRFLRRGYSGSRFVLRMTREDIGSYLGLKLETVSRLFSTFHRDGMLDVQHKHVSIMDNKALERVLAPSAAGPAKPRSRSAAGTSAT
jgi:CRP/FNR family transcriptional regulator